MDKITHILENVVRCKYFEAGVHIKNPIKNSYQDDLGRTTQILDHVVVVRTLIGDKRKSQINEYSDMLCMIQNGIIQYYTTHALPNAIIHDRNGDNKWFMLEISISVTYI